MQGTYLEYSLNTRQQELYNILLNACKNKENALISSYNKKIGKTTILRHLGFELQFLGYEVLVSALNCKQEYIAHKFISHLNKEKFYGIGNSNTIILIDEVLRENIDDFIKYFKSKNIPIVGFVDYGIK